MADDTKQQNPDDPKQGDLGGQTYDETQQNEDIGMDEMEEDEGPSSL